MDLSIHGWEDAWAKSLWDPEGHQELEFALITYVQSSGLAFPIYSSSSMEC